MMMVGLNRPIFLVRIHLQLLCYEIAVEEKIIEEVVLHKFCSIVRKFAETNEKTSAKALLLRKKRSLTVSLESREKRVKDLEFG